jgi:hypothetical protein
LNEACRSDGLRPADGDVRREQRQHKDQDHRHHCGEVRPCLATIGALLSQARQPEAFDLNVKIGEALLHNHAHDDQMWLAAHSLLRS